MQDRVEWLSGALSFTPLLGILDLILITHFLTSWFFSAKKTGWKIDLWYFTLFIGLFQYLFMMYPFNGSEFNQISTGPHQDVLVPYVDLAFIIGVVGYIFLWAGRLSHHLIRSRFGSFTLGSFLPRIIELNVKSRFAFLTLSSVVVILGLCLLGFQFSQGNYFHGRALFLSHDLLRPLFNMMISLAFIFFTFFSLRFVQIKKKSEVMLFVLVMGIALFSGVRGLIFMGLLQLLLYNALYCEGRVSVFKFSFCLLLLFVVAVFVGNAREGIFDPLLALQQFFIYYLYGNNFSDTRDFASLLAYWDGEFLYGKTYVAALLSFIPRALIPLREEWGMAMITNQWMGFDSTVMPGLRPGLFGEAFFNFGFPGVALFSWLLGFALKFADEKMKECVHLSKDLIKGYSYILLFSFVSGLMVTGSLWTFYVFILVNFVLIPFRFLSFYVNSKLKI